MSGGGGGPKPGKKQIELQRPVKYGEAHGKKEN
jgi:hypothetical protein